MNTVQLTKYITELIQIVNANIVLANDISEQLGLPVNESLTQFNKNFRNYLLNNVPSHENDRSVVEENARLREEVEYINESSRRQKHNFAECSAALRDNIEQLESSLVLTRTHQAKCNEQLEKAKSEITTSTDELSFCRRANDEYIRELESLRLRLIDESDAYRQKVEASNAMSDMHLSDIEVKNQDKINNYIKTITELRSRIYDLNNQIQANNEMQDKLKSQTVNADIESIERLEAELRSARELITHARKKNDSIQTQLDIVNSEKQKALEQIIHLESALQVCKDALGKKDLSLNSLNEQIHRLNTEKANLTDEISYLNAQIDICKSQDSERAEYEAMLTEQSTIRDLETIESTEDALKTNTALLEHVNHLYLDTQNQLNIERREALANIERVKNSLISAHNAKEESAMLITTTQKRELMDKLQNSELKLRETEASLLLLNERITRLSEDKVELAKLLQDSEQTIRNLHENHKKIIFRGIERFKNIIRTQIGVLATSIDSYDDKQLRIHVKQIISELSTETGVIALLVPKKSVGPVDYNSTNDELNDLTARLSGADAVEARRRLIEDFLHKKLDDVILSVKEHYQLELEAAAHKGEVVIVEPQRQNYEYTKLIDEFMRTKRSEDFEILLKHEIRKRDDKIKQLTNIIQNIPESQLNERIKKMSFVRKNQLIEILTKFATKITPYDSNLGNQLKTYMSKLNREFDEVYDYVDNIVSILIDINISGFSKLSQTLDRNTLNDLSISLRDMRENIESNSPRLADEFTRLFGEIQTTIDFIGDSRDLSAGMIEQNDKITAESTRSNYHEILKEVTAFRDNVSAEKTKFIRNQLNSLLDMEKLDDTTTPSDPINYFITINELELTKASKQKLLDLFKNLIEKNQNAIDELNKRLREVERDLAESKNDVQSSKRTIAEMQTKLASNKQLVKSLQDELVSKNALINDLQSTKRRQESLKSQLDNSSGDVESLSTIIGMISTILKNYTELCRTSANTDLLREHIDSLSATMPLKSAVSVLDSITRLLTPLVEEPPQAPSTSQKRRISSDTDEHNTKVSRYSSDDEEDLIAMNNQQMYMQMVYGGKSASEARLNADALVAELKSRMSNNNVRLQPRRSMRIAQRPYDKRRSSRIAGKSLSESKQRDIEDKITLQVEDGLKVDNVPEK